MSNLEQMIKEQAQELARLQAQKAQEEAQKAKAKAFEWNSQVALVKFLEQYLDAQIKLGRLDQDIYFSVFRKYRKVYQDLDDQLAFFVSTVIKLISHPWWGVECSTAFLGNGGLKYRGQSYADPKKLYEVIFQTILGDFANNPFESDVWFYELLEIHFQDPTALPAYAQAGQVKSRVLPLLQRVVELEKNGIEIPDLDQLTSDDALYIQSLVG